MFSVFFCSGRHGLAPTAGVAQIPSLPVPPGCKSSRVVVRKLIHQRCTVGFPLQITPKHSKSLQITLNHSFSGCFSLSLLFSRLYGRAHANTFPPRSPGTQIKPCLSQETNLSALYSWVSSQNRSNHSKSLKITPGRAEPKRRELCQPGYLLGAESYTYRVLRRLKMTPGQYIQPFSPPVQRILWPLGVPLGAARNPQNACFGLFRVFKST